VTGRVRGPAAPCRRRASRCLGTGRGAMADAGCGRRPNDLRGHGDSSGRATTLGRRRRRDPDGGPRAGADRRGRRLARRACRHRSPRATWARAVSRSCSWMSFQIPIRMWSAMLDDRGLRDRNAELGMTFSVGFRAASRRLRCWTCRSCSYAANTGLRSATPTWTGSVRQPPRHHGPRAERAISWPVTPGGTRANPVGARHRVLATDDIVRRALSCSALSGEQIDHPGGTRSRTSDGARTHRRVECRATDTAGVDLPRVVRHRRFRHVLLPTTDRSASSKSSGPTPKRWCTSTALRPRADYRELGRQPLPCSTDSPARRGRSEEPNCATSPC